MRQTCRQRHAQLTSRRVHYQIFHVFHPSTFMLTAMRGSPMAKMACKIRATVHWNGHHNSETEKSAATSLRWSRSRRNIWHFARNWRREQLWHSGREINSTDIFLPRPTSPMKSTLFDRQSKKMVNPWIVITPDFDNSRKPVNLAIAIFLVTSPIVINVPTKELLAVETKSYFV